MGAEPPGAGKPETTASLLAQAKRGDEAARNRLVTRLLPGFRRWARGRVPARARSILDTDDLVQVSLLKALNHLSDFEPRHSGALMGYLRSVLLNEIRQEVRRCSRRPQQAELPSGWPDDEPSPLETVVGREALASYEAALAKLSEVQRDAVLLRLELQFTYEEIAEAIGSPSANAARMLIKRALLHLAEEMEHAR